MRFKTYNSTCYCWTRKDDNHEILDDKLMAMLSGAIIKEILYVI